jgi:hypothetical protein
MFLKNTFRAISFLILISCSPDAEEPLLKQSDVCQLNNLLPISIIYERMDINTQQGIISCYHTPMSVTPSDSIPCMYAADRDLDYSAYGFYLLGLNQSGKDRIFGGEILSPSWSHDGNWLLWSNNENIFKMPIRNGALQIEEVEKLTFDSTLLRYPQWSPDDQQILFQSDVTLNASVYLEDGFYVMNADGTNARFLPEIKENPIWKSPEEILFFDGNNLYEYDLRSGSAEFLGSMDGSLIKLTDPVYHEGHVYFVGFFEDSSYRRLYRIHLSRPDQAQLLLDAQILELEIPQDQNIYVTLVEERVTHIARFDRSNGRAEKLYGYETAP